jgi:hypothetical protein
MEPTKENIMVGSIFLFILFIGLVVAAKFVRDHFDNQQ